MANISSYFGGSGGGGLNTDFTTNDYGVPLPEYITRVDYKNSCTVTVCPNNTSMCCRGIGQGGIINVRDNIFIAVGVEGGLSGSTDCTRGYAMAFCVNDDTGEITSGMTEFKCIYQSASTNDRFAWEVDAPAAGDGCCRAYIGFTCSSVQRYRVLCTNDTFSCIGTGPSITQCGDGNTAITYNGCPGQILLHNRSNNICTAYVRVCNGTVCYNGLLPGTTTTCCLDAASPGTGRAHYALSPNTIIAYGACMQGGDCLCQRTVLYHWDEAGSTYHKSFCKTDGPGNIFNNQARCCIMCCTNPGKILSQSYRVGSTWYVEGGGAVWYRQEDRGMCSRNMFDMGNCQCCMAFSPEASMLCWNGLNNWNQTYIGYSGCFTGASSCMFFNSNQFNIQWTNDGFCQCNNHLTTQINGTLNPGISPTACCAYNCGQQLSGAKQEGFGSFAREPNPQNLLGLNRAPINQYPIPMFCNCYYTCCFHFLTSAVVGCKWIVTMEARNLPTCECITLHSYKIMTNQCTAD